jgi:hypothetical protein
MSVYGVVDDLQLDLLIVDEPSPQVLDFILATTILAFEQVQLQEQVVDLVRLGIHDLLGSLDLEVVVLDLQTQDTDLMLQTDQTLSRLCYSHASNYFCIESESRFLSNSIS